MKISVAVMAHNKRKWQARDLYIDLVKYPFSYVGITWDQKNEEWDTGKRALQQGIYHKSDWHIVIQDDALITLDFYNNIVGAITALKEKSLISLYTGTSRPLGKRVKAAVEKAQDGEWLSFSQLLWGVAILIPTDHIAPMLDFVENIELQYDNKIGEFYRQNALPVYYCIPSLVEHDDEMGSILGHGQSPEPRVAHRLATGLVEWSDKKYYI